MNHYLSAVNQKLFFCNLLLQQGKLASQESRKEKQSVHLELALCQSALYQLEVGYRHYLREIAATYQFKTPEILSTADELASALSNINKHPAEAQEILGLLEQNNSWLSTLLGAHQQLSSLSTQTRSSQVKPSEQTDTLFDSQIAVVEVKQLDESVELSHQALANWHQSFVEMVNRHRELMVEC
mgnify:CR=1 FL=1|jgi:hypothetical protein